MVRLFTVLGVLAASGLIAAALLWPRTEPAAAGVSIPPGDVDCNGVVSIADAQLIAQFVVGRISELSCVSNPMLQPGEVLAIALAWVSGDETPDIYQVYTDWSCFDARWDGAHWWVTCSAKVVFTSNYVDFGVCVFEETLTVAPC